MNLKTGSKKTGSKKITDFFLTHPFFRAFNVFVFHHLRSFLIKAVLLILSLIIIAIVILKFFQPQLLQEFYNKSALYISYQLNLNANDFDKINIVGNNRVSKEEIISLIREEQKNFFDEKNFKYSSSIENLIDRLRSKLPWIKEVTISRGLPDILNINIVEYEPFAIWQIDGKKYIIDRDGNMIPFENLEGLEKMIILSGAGANIHARSLFNIFTIDPKLSQNVYSATWVGNRRWDIRFENGLLIKLPKQNISHAWQKLIKIYQMPGLTVGLIMIDLRIEDRIYLEYEDSAMKELKSI